MTSRVTALGLAAALILVGMPFTPVGKAASKKQPTPATTIAAAVAKALGRTKTVEATGLLQGEAKLTTHYIFQYASPDRERLVRSGGAINVVKVAGRSAGTEEEISVGRDLFRRIGASGWLRSTRALAPAAADALTLNALDEPCCEISAGPGATTVRLLGSSTYRGQRIYVLRFRHITSAGIVKTTIYVNKKTFLPMAYTSAAFPALGTSYVQLHYNVHVTIASPR